MNKKITLSLIAALGLTSANAFEFKPVGFKAVGMGGTGVASTRGSLSGYYNPALLRFSDSTAEFSINMGVRVRESNLIDNMDALSDVDFAGAIDTLGENSENSNLFVTAPIINGELITAGNNIAVDTATQNAINALSDGQTIDIDGTTFTKVDNGTLTYSQTGTADNTEAAENLAEGIDIITKRIGANNGFQFSVTPSFAAQLSDAFALGVYANLDFGFRMNIDGQYDRLITEQQNNDGENLYYEYDITNDRYTVTNDSTDYYAHSLEYANNPDNGINYIEVNAMVLAETPLSFAKAFETSYGTWSIGANLKPMALTTFSDRIALGESSDDAEDSSDDSSNETTYSPTLGLDLGFAYRPTASDITFGLMAKNINKPTFEVDQAASSSMTAEDYEIEPMYRAGISLPIFNDTIEFAFDMDLTENDTLTGDKSKMMGVGIELHPASWFALRVGAMQDTASEKFDDGVIVTGGLGFGLKWAQIDLTAMASSEQGEYDGEAIPRYMALNFSLVSKWGDGYNRKTPDRSNDSSYDPTQQNTTISPSEKNRINQRANKAYEELD